MYTDGSFKPMQPLFPEDEAYVPSDNMDVDSINLVCPTLMQNIIIITTRFVI